MTIQRFRYTYYMVFDVESIGLHGEAFAVGWLVVDGHGNEYEQDRIACSPYAARGTDRDRAWVDEHITLKPSDLCHHSPRGVRETFWCAWREWRAKGAVLVADCPWPVEARFLNECIAEDPAARAGDGPYPLIDVASVRLAAGFDPLATCDRLPDELPAHDPLADARQSARLLREALAQITA